MKWKLFSTAFVLSAMLSLVSNVDARTRGSRYRDAQNNKVEQTECGVGKGPGYGKEIHEMTMGYSAPARINCEGGWDIFLEGSFIYWFVGQDQMDLASTIEPLPEVGPRPHHFGMVRQNQKYKPGFKVALGGNFCHDNWTGKMEYTRIHGTTLTTATVPPSQNPDQIEPDEGLYVNEGWGHNINRQSSYLRTKWKVKQDTIDTELGRAYYSGRMFTIHPFYGTRMGWMKQKINFFAIPQNPNFETQEFLSRSKMKSWFVGPRAGVDAKFILDWGFRFTGSAAASLLYQRQKVRASLYDAFQVNPNWGTVKEKYRSVTPNAEVGAGFGWGSYLMDNSWHLDILAAYEFHYWWNQNRIRETLTKNEWVGPGEPVAPGDLFYHGLTLTFRLDF